MKILAIHEFVDSLANKKEICPAATSDQFMRLLNKFIEERKKNKEVINENY